MASCANTRRRRTKEGKCSICLWRKRSPGHATCRECRVRVRAYSTRRYEERKALGLCWLCDEPADGYLCEVHAAERRARRRAV